MFSEPANELFSLADKGNFFLVASAGDMRIGESVPAWFSETPCDYDFFAGHSGHFPVWTSKTRLPRRRLGSTASRKNNETEQPVMLTNLSKPICDYLRHLGYENPEQNGKAAKTLWLHALAVLYTPSYRRENRDALHRGWPRIPLPGFTGKMQVDEARRIIEESAEMGRNIRDILTGTPPPVCPPCIAVLTNGERPLDIANDRRFALEVDGDWDIPGKWNAVRPRPGRYHNRPYKLGEIKALSTLAKKVGMGSETWDNALGNEMVDIALNQYTYCQGIPARVWEYPIGGRQVLAKWLSYREYKIIHRPLRHDEVMHFIDTARRLTILCMLEATLEQLWEQNETRHG